MGAARVDTVLQSPPYRPRPSAEASSALSVADLAEPMTGAIRPCCYLCCYFSASTVSRTTPDGCYPSEVQWRNGVHPQLGSDRIL